MTAGSVECYIEEYWNEHGELCARLREIGTNRHVRIEVVNPAQKQHFLEFLNAAGVLFKTFGRSDPIVVSGNVVSSTPRGIDFAYDERIGYVIA